MNIRDFLHYKHLSNKEFAAKIGVSCGTLGNILNGFDFKLSTAFKIIEISNGEISFEDLRPKKNLRKQ